MANHAPDNVVGIVQQTEAGAKGAPAPLGPMPPGTLSRADRLLATLRTGAHGVLRAWTDRRRAWDKFMGRVGTYRRDRRKPASSAASAP